MQPTPRARRLAALTLGHIRRIIQTIHSQSVTIEAAVGLTGPQFWALREVASAPSGLTMGELAARLALHKATAGRLVDRLRGKRLVTSIRPVHDRRIVLAQATPRGRELAARPAPSPAQADLLTQLEHQKVARLAKVEAALGELVHLLGAEHQAERPIFDEPPRRRRRK